MNRLRELRTSKGLTQKEVAIAIGVSPQSYGYYENEINKPDPDILIKLADFFGCSIDYILLRENDYGIIENNKTFLTERQSKLLNSFNLLSNDDQNKVLGFIKALEK